MTSLRNCLTDPSGAFAGVFDGFGHYEDELVKVKGRCVGKRVSHVAP